MTPWPPLREEDLLPVVTWFTAATCFCLFHYGASAERYRARAGAPSDTTERRALGFQRLGGALLLGVVPAGVSLGALGGTGASLGLGAPDGVRSLAWFAGTAGVVLPVVALAARGEAHGARYPEMRLSRWTGADFLHDAWTWAVYLLAYEVFFRGFLLSGLVASLGVWPALAAMTALYTLSHLPKGAGETFACLAMGPLFGWMTLDTGGVWAAFAVHFAIAFTSDLVAVRAANARAGA